MSRRYASVASSVPYTLAADASAGDGAASSADASSQLISLSTSALACTRARLSCTHSESMSRFPWTSVVELVGDQLPAAVLLADQAAGRDPDVLVIGGACVDARHGVYRRPGEAL